MSKGVLTLCCFLLALLTLVVAAAAHGSSRRSECEGRGGVYVVAYTGSVCFHKAAVLWEGK